MTCDECNQHPATVHLTRVINGKKTERHLCEQCARELGEFEFVIEPKFSVPNLLAGLMQLGPQFKPLAVPAGRQCDVCKMTHGEFARTGRLGCARCYEVFSKELEPLLKRIHGSSVHTGKTPITTGETTVSSVSTVERLKQELKECIDQELFERAAEIRDEIRQIESAQRGERQ